MKVKITEKVSAYWFKGVCYGPGDVVEIPAKNFCADFMEKVVKPKPAPAPKPTKEETPSEKEAEKKAE